MHFNGQVRTVDGVNHRQWAQLSIILRTLYCLETLFAVLEIRGNSNLFDQTYIAPVCQFVAYCILISLCRVVWLRWG